MDSMNCIYIGRIGEGEKAILYSWQLLKKKKKREKKKKKWSLWILSSNRPGNPKPGVGSQRGIWGEEQCGSLCRSRAEKTNRFPWKEIMFRLHLRRPHKADQSTVCCVEQQEEERVWCSHTNLCTHKRLRAMLDRDEDLSDFFSSVPTRSVILFLSFFFFSWSKAKCVAAVVCFRVCWLAMTRPSGLLPGFGALLVYRQSDG